MESEKKMEDFSFEESLQNLENIVKLLEKGDIPLEESFSLYQKGVELSKICASRLDSIEGKIQMVNENKDGEENLKEKV